MKSSHIDSSHPRMIMALTDHPIASLNPPEQLALGVLVEPLACRSVDLDEWLRFVRMNEPGASDEELQTSVNELIAGGYAQRVAERPATYRPTPAGLDAAIGYGVLEVKDADPDTRKETVG